MKIYVMIFNEIKQKIENGLYKVNEQLPSLRELSKIYNTTPVTVKKSLMILQEKGYINAVDRVGFFVLPPSTNNLTFVFHEIQSIKSNIDEMEIISVANLSLNEISNLFSRGNINIDKKIKNCICIKRIFKSHSIPIAYDIKYLFMKSNIDTEKHDDKFHKRVIDSLLLLLEGHEITKEIFISILDDNKICKDNLLLDEVDSVFEVFQIYKTSNSQIVGHSYTYIPCEEMELEITSESI